MEVGKEEIRIMLFAQGLKGTDENVEYIRERFTKPSNSSSLLICILKNQYGLPDKNIKQFEKTNSSSETTFPMFIHPENERALIAALQYVHAKKELSTRVGVEKHYVEFERQPNHPPTNNSNPNSIWYSIKVSRPYLIFIIGQEYANRGGL